MRSHGIVLHSLRYGDHRIIVDIFTEAAGVVPFIVPQSRIGRNGIKASAWQPLALVEVAWQPNVKTALQRPKELSLWQPWRTLTIEPRKTAMSLFLSEFLYHALRSEQQDKLLFAYVCDSMEWLDTVEVGFANFHLTFLMRMSRFLGFYPNLEVRGEGREVREQSLLFDLREGRFCTTTPLHRDFLDSKDSQLIHTLMRMDFPTMHLFQLSHHDRNRITEVLLHYYRLHIPQFPELKSLGVLQELWT